MPEECQGVDLVQVEGGHCKKVQKRIEGVIGLVVKINALFDLC